jgi:DnaJ-class molecular chaperone
VPRGPLEEGPPANGAGPLPALEEVCLACKGTGHVPGHRQGGTIVMGGRCDDCFGAGTIATDDGKRLLAFLQRHGR